MNQNPIYKVLSILEKYTVKALLIGGQATITYGAAEFSRDIDFAILLDKKNLDKLKSALKELKAKQIYFPPLKIEYLKRGHACHFRCNLPEIKGFRVDVIAKLRGCEEFYILWQRRKSIKGPNGITINIISLEDLVRSKKTQRDKDWLMIKRLLETDVLNIKSISDKKILWWLMECRTPDLLIEVAKRHSTSCEKLITKRPLLQYALKNKIESLRTALINEEWKERDDDKKYWLPLRKELQQLRHKKNK